MKKNKPILAIVVPCYNEEEILLYTDENLGQVLNSLKKQEEIHENSFILYVDDGSKDNTWELIMERITRQSHRQGVKLSRNFGHQSALLAGLNNIKGNIDCVITIDADLQDDIDVIGEMVKQYKNGFEVVYGVRRRRDKDTLFKRKTALFFYNLMKFLGVEIIYNHADYRLTGSEALDKFFEFKEVNLFLRGIYPLLGYSGTCVYYDRKERTAGETKYPFRKMLAFALDGITSFSIKPLRMVTLIGFVVFMISIFLALFSLYSYLFLGTVPGWTSITLPIYFISGIQILCIGILGEYLGKIYKEVKARPRFIVEKFLKS